MKVLFSDCATATLLTKSDNEPKFDFYSDGGKCFSLSQQYISIMIKTLIAIILL